MGADGERTARPNSSLVRRGLGALTVESSRAMLAAACEVVGLDARDAALIRLGEHAVFRLASGPVVARVARTEAYAVDAAKEVAVARWLAEADFPAPRPVAVDQPVPVDGSVVTFLESVSDTEQPTYATLGEVAELLRRLHRLKPPDWLELPVLVPFARAERRITEGHLPEADRAFLRHRLERLQQQFAGLEFVLPIGPVHGDASIGNVIRDRSGRPVLIDLDGFAIGPREWDLVLTATYYDSFGWHTTEEYTQFVQRYGVDVMAWPGYRVLRDIRELLMVTWLSQKAADNETTAAELRRRIEDLRTGSSRKGWRPY